jgi:hypothetical protein
VATLAGDHERRSERRRSAGGARCRADAVLRPGQPVRVLNINSRAALVESGARLRPGASTELQLTIDAGRARVRGRLDRCYVAALEPLRYRGLLVFEDSLVLADEPEERTA